MAVVVVVLLIACANAANFLLAQATTRRREMAIRSALGASRRRVIQQALTESTLLALLGGCAGTLLALWVNPLLLSLRPPNLPVRLDVPFDIRVLGFTAIISLVTGIIFGLIPALRSTRVDLAPTLKDEVQGGYRRSRLRNGLMISQVALCLLLLVGGVLCLRSLWNAQSIDTGFQTQNRIAAKLDLKSLDYPSERGKRFYQDWIDRVAALPGVQSVSIASYLPLETTSLTIGVQIAGQEPPAGQDSFHISTMDVGPDFFRTLGTPVMRGREFQRHDDETAPRVMVINEAMAERFWPGENPIGQRVVAGELEKGQSYEVVGVVKTGKYRTLSESPRPALFRSFLQAYRAKATLVAHTNADAGQLLKAVREEVQRLDPNLALIESGTLKEHLAFTLFPAQVTGLLLGVFGLLALLLAVVGLSGVIAYSVGQRTHEIGVRMALGAQRQDVLRLVVGQGMSLSLIGIVLGLVVAVALTRFLSSFLYQIEPTDPATFLLVSVLMAVVSLLACYFPARRATQVDPMVALRCE
jgi:putative ABC transport system permease protein